MRDVDRQAGSALTAIEGDDGDGFSSEGCPADRVLCPWRSRYEHERVRSEALRWDEVAARTRVGGLIAQQAAYQRKISALVEQVTEVRKTAREALFLEAEVARLTHLLEQAGVATKAITNLSLRRENARLQASVEWLKARIETLEAEREVQSSRIESLEAERTRLRLTRAILTKTFSGGSEQQDKAPSTRPRGQQRGAPGHGRTPRRALKAVPEQIDPPPEQCVCSHCGKPYPNLALFPSKSA